MTRAVAGMSWGGVVAQELYRRRPELVACLILADSYAGWAGSLPAEVCAERLASCLAQADMPPDEVAAQWLPSLFSEHAPAEVVEELGAILRDFRPAGLRLVAPAVAAADHRDLLPRIEAPTLLLWGEHDARSPVAIAERMRDAIRGAELAVIPDCGHVSNLERPDLFNAKCAASAASSAPKLPRVLPNILLVVLDTARADAFEPYGAAPGATPGDRRPRPARPRPRGASTRRRAGPCPRTRRCSPGCCRGRPGSSTCPRARRSPGARRSPRTATASSPTCCAPTATRPGPLSTNLWVTVESGFGLGFDEFRYIGTGRQAHLDRTGLRDRLRWAREALRAKADDGAAAAAATICAGGSTRSGSKPFFWFVNLVECHSPYLPPWPYGDLGPIDRLRAAEEARRHLTLSGIWKACAGGFDVAPGALERMRHLYARSVRLLDDWVRDLLAELDRRGLLDGTLVIVTSDHGENFGDGGLMGHAFSLDQRLLRVPLVIAGPGRAGRATPASSRSPRCRG